MCAHAYIRLKPIKLVIKIKTKTHTKKAMHTLFYLHFANPSISVAVWHGPVANSERPSIQFDCNMLDGWIFFFCFNIEDLVFIHLF